MQKLQTKVPYYAVFRSKKEHDEYFANIVSQYLATYMKPIRSEAFNQGLGAATSYGIDMAVIALGRIAEENPTKLIDISDPEFFTQFMLKITEATKDYDKLFDLDVEENHDKDLWWSGSKLDDELYQYVSRDIYPSFEERYKKEVSS